VDCGLPHFHKGESRDGRETITRSECHMKSNLNHPWPRSGGFEFRPVAGNRLAPNRCCLEAGRNQSHGTTLAGQVCPLVFPAALRSVHLALHASMAGVAAKEGNVIETASKTIGNVRITDFTLIALLIATDVWLASPPAYGAVQYTGHSLVSVARSTCNDWLSLFARSSLKALCASHMRNGMRSGLSCVNYFSFWRLLQGGDPLPRTANCLKIILLVDPSALRCGGV
jgi:hypothetical protein